MSVGFCFSTAYNLEHFGDCIAYSIPVAQCSEVEGEAGPPDRVI